jgi:Tfp pilus assembly protein PilV
MANDGFSLLELQVSFFLISIAVLGVARYQVFAQEQVAQGHYRGQALSLMETASRRIYLNASNYLSYQSSNIENLPPIVCDPCTPQKLVQLDLFLLSTSLKHSLPMATARILQCDQRLCMQVAWGDGALNRCAESKHCLERVIY